MKGYDHKFTLAVLQNTQNSVTLLRAPRWRGGLTLGREDGKLSMTIYFLWKRETYSFAAISFPPFPVPLMLLQSQSRPLSFPSHAHLGFSCWLGFWHRECGRWPGTPGRLGAGRREEGAAGLEEGDACGESWPPFSLRVRQNWIWGRTVVKGNCAF